MAKSRAKLVELALQSGVSMAGESRGLKCKLRRCEQSECHQEIERYAKLCVRFVGLH